MPREASAKDQLKFDSELRQLFKAFDEAPLDVQAHREDAKYIVETYQSEIEGKYPSDLVNNILPILVKPIERELNKKDL